MAMKSEKEKMLAGELYQASDPELVQERLKARALLQLINTTAPTEPENRVALLRKLVGKAGKNPWIEVPFYCDYGYNIQMGEDCFFLISTVWCWMFVRSNLETEYLLDQLFKSTPLHIHWMRRLEAHFGSQASL